MKVQVHRDVPSPPPITDISIHLTPVEAYKLLSLCGQISRSDIRVIFDLPGGRESDPAVTQQVEEMFKVTADIYNQMTKELKIEDDGN